MAKKQNPASGLKLFLLDLFDLHEDKERETVTIREISKDVEFRGTNLWILIFAILIASIGLNVNSTPVVIGAMLISPLMGPIMGIGLGAGINDFDLIKKAFRNLAIAVAISVLTSALYFVITPLHEAQSELLSRTYPTLWDVLIGFFGGLAGIVAGSRKEKTNAIPGVAIATALMPPLCTAGYGLANLNWYYFVGAFYLFFINSVFISVATFLIVRFLGYPKKKFEDPGSEARVKRYIAVFVIITLVPSVYLAYHLVQRTLFNQNARNFIANEFVFEETEVIHQEFTYAQEGGIVEVTLYGKPLKEPTMTGIRKNLPLFGLENVDLQIHQGYFEQPDMSGEFERMSNQIRLSVIEDLYKQNQDVIADKDTQIALLESELVKARSTAYPVKDIAEELRIHYPHLTEFAMSDALYSDLSRDELDTLCLAHVGFRSSPKRQELQQITEWLKLRVDADSLRLVVLN
ncbi:MAG: TIGR00341 family protein [Bacteroidota bacterium]